MFSVDGWLRGVEEDLGELDNLQNFGFNFLPYVRGWASEFTNILFKNLVSAKASEVPSHPSVIKVF